MQTDVKQVFYFHADAHSTGGFIEGPFRHIPTSCSVALSPTGGGHTTSSGVFNFEDSVHARASHTHVFGRHTQRNGPWTQHVVSVVEGFSLFGRISAERLISQIAIEHPEAGGGHRTISFAGSRIDGLRIDGKPVTPVLNPVLLPEPHRGVDIYNETSIPLADIKWPILAKTAHSQAVELLQQPDLPAWIRDRFGWIAAKENGGALGPEGYTLCSLVDKVEGLEPGQSFGHCIDLPELGRIFLGEASVFQHAVSLTMIRAELGCAVRGQASAASAGTNGSTIPPGYLPPPGP